MLLCRHIVTLDKMHAFNIIVEFSMNKFYIKLRMEMVVTNPGGSRSWIGAFGWTPSVRSPFENGWIYHEWRMCQKDNYPTKAENSWTGHHTYDHCPRTVNDEILTKQHICCCLLWSFRSVWTRFSNITLLYLHILLTS